MNNYAVRDGLLLCPLTEIYYSRPQAVKHSRRANLQVGRTAFEKGRVTDFFLRERKGDSCFARPLNA